MEKSLDQEITQLEKRVINRLLRQSIEPNLESAELEHHRPYVTYRRKLEFIRSCLSNLLSLSTLIYVLIGFNVAYLYLFSLELLGSLLSTTNINELYGAGLVYFLPTLTALIVLVWQFVRTTQRSNHLIMLIPMTLIVIAQFVFSTVMTSQLLSFKRLELEFPPITDTKFQDMNFGGLMLKGGIGSKSYKSLLKFDENFEINTIILDSQGGDIDSAIAIGRWVAENNVPVVVDGVCFSTCVIIAVSGPTLYASKNSSFFFDQGGDNAYTALLGKLKVDLNGHSVMESELKNRGVPDKVVEWVRKRPSSQKRYITALELQQLGVIDSIIQ